jgi:cytochrome c oxidase subunit 3
MKIFEVGLDWREESIMASTLLPPSAAPAPEKEPPLADNNNGNGFGGGNFDDPDYGPHQDPEPDPERWAAPPSAYRTATLFVIFSVLSVFATLTHVLESRWGHSKDWVSISLPPILYVNTAILLLSSLTIELARLSRATQASRRCARWLFVTLLLGLAFVGGQLVAWRALVFRGLYVASNPGSFFFYMLTAVHGIHLLGGILALVCVVSFHGRLAREGKLQTAVGSVALYWHFMDVLWVYLLALLFLTIQH